MDTTEKNLLCVVFISLFLCGYAWGVYGSGLVAHWGFDEGNGTTAYDSAGTSHGVIHGPVWTSGQIGGALSFDGQDDYVEVGDDPNLDGMPALTLAAWIKAPGDGMAGVVSKYNAQNSSSSDDSYYLRIDDNGKLTFVYRIGSSYVVKTGMPIVTDDSWHYVAGVYTGSVGRIYIDGNEVPLSRNDPDPGGAVNASDEDLFVGCLKLKGQLKQFFTGTIDDVCIYDRDLSETEIRETWMWGQLYGQNMVTNSGFETAEVTGGGWPSSYGDWNGDDSSIVASELDVEPDEGSQMLKFAGTSAGGAGSEDTCQVYQIVDVNAFAVEIAEDRATALASAYFNRVAGDANTDTEFFVDIRAFAGDPCDFPTLQDTGSMHLAVASSSILSEGDPCTWEYCEAQLSLPNNTDFAVIGIGARENTLNNEAAPEFDGHFADLASLVITTSLPEPNVGMGVYYVDGVNGSDLYDGLSIETAFATIQKGIDTAQDGNAVRVYPAVYNEGVDFDGKAITVRGVVTPAGVPVIEIPEDFAVSFYLGEGPNSVLEHFVIRNSEMAIFLADTSPTISHLTVVDNELGIAAYGYAEPHISNCIFWNNTDGDLYQCEAQYSWVQEEVNEPNEPNAPEVPIAGLLSHWKLDELSGSTAYDSAGGNHGTVYGATWTSGQIGGALDFDGLDDYVGLPDNNPVWLPRNDFTLCVWVYFHAEASDKETLLDLNWARSSGASARLGYGLIRQGDSKVNLEIITGNGKMSSAVSVSDVAKEKWYHLVAVRDATLLAIYIDGALDNESVCGPDSVDFVGTYDNDQVHIGKYNSAVTPGGSNFEARAIIEDARIYDRGLSGEEIGLLYEAGFGTGGAGARPLFANAAGWDYHLRSERGRYWPEHDSWILDDVTSPAIDIGDPAVEPVSEPMPNGGRVNAGVYGNTRHASMSEWSLPDDRNLDGIVNWIDMAMLAENWLERFEWAE